jgi:HEAT repeat protein
MRILTCALLAVLAGWGCRPKVAPAPAPAEAPKGDKGAKVERDWEAVLAGPRPLRWQEAADELARQKNAAALLRHVRTPSVYRRYHVTVALRQVELSPEALADLAAVLQEWTTELRGKGRIKGGPDAPVTNWKIPGDEDLHACQNLVELLGARRATAAVPVFEDMLKDADPIMRASIYKAAGGLGPRAAGILAAGLGDWRVRPDVERALEKIGAEAVPALARALKGANQDTGMSVCRSLRKIGPKAGAAVPALLEALKGSDEQVGWAAVNALRAIRPEAKETVPSLIEALRHKSPDVCWRAAEVLASLGPAAKDAVGPLMAALKRPQHLSGEVYQEGEDGPPLSLHEALIDALGKIGPAARESVPALRPFRKDPEARVRTATEKALKAIEAK